MSARLRRAAAMTIPPTISALPTAIGTVTFSPEHDRGEDEPRDRLQELQGGDPGDAAAIERPVPADVAENRRHDREEDDRPPRLRACIRHAVVREEPDRERCEHERPEQHAPEGRGEAREATRRQHRAGDIPGRHAQRCGEHEQVAGERRIRRGRAAPADQHRLADQRDRRAREPRALRHRGGRRSPRRCP